MKDLTYHDIFGELVEAAYHGEIRHCAGRINPSGAEHLKRYLKYASGRGNKNKVVFKAKDCETREAGECHKCQTSCLFDAIARDKNGKIIIKAKLCSGCGKCVEACADDCLVDKKEFVPLVELLRNKTTPVFAIVAPAFVGQFGNDVTPAKLRTALKMLGFYGMVEVALFADILTLKEALEFDIHVRSDEEFILTSCCCPIWVTMVKRIYNRLTPFISPSVSPMVACGRAIKKLHPGSKVVFIGPCVAKKAEAKEPDVKDAVDAVLTFREMQIVFEKLGIDPSAANEESSEHSSLSGRIYGRTGGVSQAVNETLKKIRPQKGINVRAIQADGVRECKILLQDLLNGKFTSGNFYEGMGCIGGCVGGPQALLKTDEGIEQVNNYGQEAEYLTPADNIFVLELLKSLGIQEIDELLEGTRTPLFIRDFAQQ